MERVDTHLPLYSGKERLEIRLEKERVMQSSFSALGRSECPSSPPPRKERVSIIPSTRKER